MYVSGFTLDVKYIALVTTRGKEFTLPFVVTKIGVEKACFQPTAASSRRDELRRDFKVKAG